MEEIRLTDPESILSDEKQILTEVTKAASLAVSRSEMCELRTNSQCRREVSSQYYRQQPRLKHNTNQTRKSGLSH